jgi:hypothetical protein
MATLVLRLFFYGAIALVPNSTRPSTEMTAYLMKIEGDCTHTPLLTFLKTGASECPLSPAQACADPLASSTTCCGVLKLDIQAYCVCKLVDVELVIDPATEKPEHNLRQRPGRPLPQGDEDDFSWLLRIGNIDGKANRAKTQNAILRSSPRPITAFINFGWDAASVCHVDQYKIADKVYEVSQFEFVKDADHADHQQALAEYIGFSSSLPIRPVVRIALKDIEEAKPDVKVVLDCSRGCPDVFISNSLTGDKCDDEFYAKHFDHYYELARARNRNLIPHRTNDKTTVTTEFSCGGSPPRPEEAQPAGNPLEALRQSLAAELNSAVQADASGRLKGLFRPFTAFGGGSGDLRDLLSSVLKTFPAGVLGRSATKDRGKALKEEDKKDLELLLESVQSRVICPMAMFDP